MLNNALRETLLKRGIGVLCCLSRLPLSSANQSIREKPLPSGVGQIHSVWGKMAIVPDSLQAKLNKELRCHGSLVTNVKQCLGGVSKSFFRGGGDAHKSYSVPF